MAKYKVTVDKDLADILPAFMEARRKDLADLPALLEKKDAAGLKKLGHNLHGTGGAYGFDRLTELGTELETLAAAGDFPGMQRAADAIRDYVENLEITYE